MGADERDGGSASTAHVSARTENLRQFTEGGEAYVRNLQAIFDDVVRRRSTSSSQLLSDALPEPLAAKPGYTSAADPFAELIAEATSNNGFVAQIHDALQAFDGGQGVATAPLSVVDDALIDAGLMLTGEDLTIDEDQATAMLAAAATGDISALENAIAQAMAEGDAELVASLRNRLDRAVIEGLNEETRSAFTVGRYFFEIFDGDKVQGDLEDRFADLSDPEVVAEIEQRLRDRGYTGQQIDDALADIAEASTFYADPANQSQLRALDDANDSDPDGDQKLSANDAWIRTVELTRAGTPGWVTEARVVQHQAIAAWTMAAELNPDDLQEVWDGESRLGPLDAAGQQALVEAYVGGNVAETLDTDEPLDPYSDWAFSNLIGLSQESFSPALNDALVDTLVDQAIGVELHGGDAQNPNYVAATISLEALELLGDDQATYLDTMAPEAAGLFAASLNLDATFPDLHADDRLDYRTEVITGALEALAERAGPGGSFGPGGTAFVKMTLVTAPVGSYWNIGGPTPFADAMGQTAAIAVNPGDATAQTHHAERLTELFSDPIAVGMLASDPFDIDLASRSQLLQTAVAGRVSSEASGDVEYWYASDFADGASEVAIDLAIDNARIYHREVHGRPLPEDLEADLRELGATSQFQDLIGLNDRSTMSFRSQVIAMAVDNHRSAAWAPERFTGGGDGFDNPTINGEYMVWLARRTNPDLSPAELRNIRTIAKSEAGQQHMGLGIDTTDADRQQYIHHIVANDWTVETFEAAGPVHNTEINNAFAFSAFARYQPGSPIANELGSLDVTSNGYREAYVRAALGLQHGGGDSVVNQIVDEIGAIDDGTSISLIPIHLQAGGRNMDLMLFEVIKDGRPVYVDLNGKTYSDPGDWYDHNELPPARVTYAGVMGDSPSQSQFVAPGSGDHYDIVYRVTENYPDTFSEKYLDWIITGVVIVGGVLMVVGSGGLATPLVGAGAAAVLGTTGSVLVGGVAAYEIVSGGTKLYNHIDHGGSWTDPVATDAYFTLGQGFLTAVSVGSYTAATRGIRMSGSLAGALTYTNRGAEVIETGLNIQQAWQILESDLSTEEKRRQLAILGVLGAAEYGIPFAANRAIGLNTPLNRNVHRAIANGATGVDEIDLVTDLVAIDPDIDPAHVGAAIEAIRITPSLTAADVAYAIELKATSAQQMADLPAVRADVEQALGQAGVAQEQIDGIAWEIASQFDGVVFGDVKGVDRTIQKILLDPRITNTSGLNDLARNTIVVSNADLPLVEAELELRTRAPNRIVQELGGGNPETGFTGVNAKVNAANGMTVEIQANSPDMIYAGFDEATARQMLGNDLYEYLDANITVDGGQGHLLYEAFRQLPRDSVERAAIATEARTYHASIVEDYGTLDQTRIEVLIAARSQELLGS